MFNIPQKWENYISYSFNRIYINPAIGCNAACIYCYLPDYGMSTSPVLFEDSGFEVNSWLTKQSGFRAGKYGTLISLASWCDPFANEQVMEKTLDLVKNLAPLGNPIQLSTKFLVNKEIAESLGQLQLQSGQIVVYITVTCFEEWPVIEPGAIEPHMRLEGADNLKRTGINTCLAIKPVLPGITNSEIGEFIKVIQQHEIPFCSVGVMYSSEKIEKRILSKKLQTDGFELRAKSKGDRPPPCNTNDPRKPSLDIDTMDVIRQMIEQLERNTKAEYVISGPCAVALSYDVLCPTGVWRYLPHLCTQCRQGCRSRFAQLSVHQKAAFPQEVEGRKAVED